MKFKFISQYSEQKDSTYPSLKRKKGPIYHFITTLFWAKYLYKVVHEQKLVIIFILAKMLHTNIQKTQILEH